MDPQVYLASELDSAQVESVAAAVAAWSGSDDPAVRGGLLPKRPEDVRRAIADGLAVALFDGSKPIGYAAIYHLTAVPRAFELGTVVVDPVFRGQGLTRLIYAAVARLHDGLGGDLYSTTKSERVVSAGRHIGLEVEPYATVPSIVREPLCYQASCFSPNGLGPSVCMTDVAHGGKCTLCVRRLG